MSLDAPGQIAGSSSAAISTALRDAARKTGTDFDYLLKTAQRESNLKPTAKSPRSSATGLFQFLDQTWLATMKSAGPALGYADQASQIQQTAAGRYAVADPSQRKAILAMRTDPAASAALAGAFTRQNADALESRIGREPSGGELYIAHFLGAGGAAQLINQVRASPDTKAADLFPRAARANRSIFYGGGGAARSVSQVYNVLVAKHGDVRVASAPKAAAPAPANPWPPGFVANVVPTAADNPASAQHRDAPVFHSLFLPARAGAVSPVVDTHWGKPFEQPANPARPNPPDNLFLSLVRT